MKRRLGEREEVLVLALEPVPRAASGVGLRGYGQVRAGARARVGGQCGAKAGKRKSGSGKGKVQSERWMYR